MLSDGEVIGNGRAVGAGGVVSDGRIVGNGWSRHFRFTIHTSQVRKG